MSMWSRVACKLWGHDWGRYRHNRVSGMSVRRCRRCRYAQSGHTPQRKRPATAGDTTQPLP